MSVEGTDGWEGGSDDEGERVSSVIIYRFDHENVMIF